jgi:diguanylate cyclase (GGDEF)-like protein
MGPPDHHEPDASGTRPEDRRLRRVTAPRRAPRVDSILGRRDVALVPWISISVGMAAIAISTWLRAADGHLDLFVFWGALGGSAATAGMAAIQDSPIGLRYRGALWVYLLGGFALLVALSALAIHDRGLSTVFFSSTVMLAAYLGLVVPARWANRSIVVITVAAITVHVLQPSAGALDAVITVGLVIAGWAVGALGHLAHSRAAAIARDLSSYDPLTAMLNRRGFLEQLNLALDRRDDPNPSIALLIVDLDGFKAINDAEGHAAGDALLAWVGETLPDELPASAEIGRLGGDEFGILLTGTTQISATALARATRDALGARIGASVGVATCENRTVSFDDLFRVADAALYACKRDRSLGVQSLVAGTVTGGARRRRRGRPRNGRPLSYADLRATRRLPRMPEPGIVYGWLSTAGLLVIAAAGSVVVGGALLGHGHGLWDALIRYLGIPWVLANVVLAAIAQRHVLIADGPLFQRIFYATTGLLAIGVGTAMLAHGGLTAPIGAAFFLKALFDAAVFPRRYAKNGLGILVAGWSIVVVLGPGSTLWAMPYYLAIFGASHALGTIGYRAFAETTAHAMSLARTDALTGLNNRLGFEERVRTAIAAADADATPIGLLALDLDDFKSVNDSQGHAAGDELLRRVAETLETSVDALEAVGRLGGDEFVVMLPGASRSDAAARARALSAALAPVIGASVGHSAYPDDGRTLDALLSTADDRSYEVKRQRKLMGATARRGVA